MTRDNELRQQLEDLKTRLATVEQQHTQLSQENRMLSAREQMRDCIYRICRGMDRLDRDLLASAFHPDARVDYGEIYKGDANGFVDVAINFQSAMRDTQHIVGNLFTRVDGDQGVAESYVYAHHVIEEKDGSLSELIVGGRYLDTFTARQDQWKISFRTEILDWGRKLTITEDWFEKGATLPRGQRSRNDLSYNYLK